MNRLMRCIEIKEFKGNNQVYLRKNIKINYLKKSQIISKQNKSSHHQNRAISNLINQIITFQNQNIKRAKKHQLANSDNFKKSFKNQSKTQAF